MELMDINRIRRLSGNKIQVTLDDSLLINIEDEEEGEMIANIYYLTFENKNNQYFLSSVGIALKDLAEFGRLWYSLGEFEFRHDSVEEINDYINSKIKDYVVIPLCYFNINGRYYEINSISDILNMKNTLTEEEKGMPFRASHFSCSERFENDDSGLSKSEMEKIDEPFHTAWDRNLSLVEFIDSLSNIE